MSMVALAVVRLDQGVSRIVIAAALAVCFVTVAVMLWMESRQRRIVDRANRPY